MTARLLRNLALICLLGLAGGCGSSKPSPSPDAGPSLQAQPLAYSGGTTLGSVVRDSSGLPSGILLSWDPVPDGAEEAISGYHIYKSDEPIPDTARGDGSLRMLDDGFLQDGNGNNTVFPADPIAAGLQYEFLDSKAPGFELNFGEVWYYRFSALNDSGDEGLLSEEVVVTVRQHGVTDLSAYEAFVGEQIIVEGLRFGLYDAAIDKVTFVGAVWNPDLGVPSFETADIEANVLSWSNNQILVEVPAGATEGRVKVWINEVPAFPLDVFKCKSPYITSISPYSRFLDQAYTIQGANFGSAFSGQNLVLLDGSPVSDPSSYPIYTDVQVSFLAPAGTSFGDHELQIQNGTELTNIGHINVLNRAPVAQFSMNTNNGPVPLVVNFNAGSSFDPDDGIAEWHFDFGNGTSETRTDSSNLVFTAIYESVGLKSVTLTVTDFAGATDSITKFVTVVPAADLLVVGDQFNGAGPGNEFTANLIALLEDLDTLGVKYVVGGYSIGISQVAVDQGFTAVLWNRGGPGPGDPIQNWPRNWDNNEKADFKAILDAGIPMLLLSQNNQFTADFSDVPAFDSYYSLTLQNDTVVESGPDREFPWIFGTPTDYVHEEVSTGAKFPSSAVCLLNGSATPPLVPQDLINAAEQYTGPGSSGFRPQTCLLGQRIQGAMVIDPGSKATGVTHPNLILGLALPDGKAPFSLCYSYGMTTAPDENIGFGTDGAYTHVNGPAKLWVIGWSYSEAAFGPDPIKRHHVLWNVLGWLDSSLVPPPVP